MIGVQRSEQDPFIDTSSLYNDYSTSIQNLYKFICTIEETCASRARL